MTSRPALAALVGAIDAPPRGAMKLLMDYRSEVAHELAEKQRSHPLPEEDSPYVPYNRTVRNLADLIDPKKEGQ